MSDGQDLTAADEAAWSGFRERLADRLADLGAEERLTIEVEVGLEADELEGSAPLVVLAGWGQGLLRAEVAGNDVLDGRFQLGLAAQSRLVEAGWQEPDDDEPHFTRLATTRTVDLLAVRCVEALREAYAVPHPAFLRAEGLELDPQVPRPSVGGSGDDGPDDGRGDGADDRATRRDLEDDDEMTLPSHHEELQALVDAAIGQVTEVEHDSDGDIPLRSGASMVFVRVLADRPAIELFAEIVVEPQRPERIPVELDILNRTHDFARFHATPEAIRMSYVVVAWPFVPRQLRLVLHRMLEEVDPLAEQLALRLEGRRFLQEPEPAPEPEPAWPPRGAPPAPAHPAMSGLLELLHLGPVSSPAVAQLFEHDRRALIAQLVGIRTGTVDCAGHDREQVLTCLRRGLRYVVDREIPERRARRVPSRHRTEQTRLVSDDDLGEGTLDLDRSA